MNKKEINTVDDYINSYPGDVKTILNELRELIHSEVEGVEECIRYDMPTFNLNGKYLVYFAAWKKYVSIYPFTTEMEKHFEEASEYKISGKGTIQFPYDKPLPVSLIKKIIEFRIKENLL